RRRVAMVTLIEFTPGVTAFIRSSLTVAAVGLRRTLAQLLLALPIERGRVFTFASPSASESQLRQFDSAGVGGSQEIQEQLTELGMRYLGAGGTRYLIFEDINFSRGSPGLDTSQLPYFAYNSEVHVFLAAGAQTPEAITKLFDYGIDYPTVGILTH